MKRAFQSEGPIRIKERDLPLVVLVWGASTSSLLKERSGRWEEHEVGRSITLTCCFRVRPCCALKIRVSILNRSIYTTTTEEDPMKFIKHIGRDARVFRAKGLSL